MQVWQKYLRIQIVEISTESLALVSTQTRTVNVLKTNTFCNRENLPFLAFK